MPTIMRFQRCRIEMYFGDHPPPHFHIITKGDERVAVSIETLATIAGVADKRDTNEALAWARIHKGELLARWATYTEGD